jgi:hypothetical protein
VREPGGEKFEAQARFLDDPAERDRALAAAGRKYWMKKIHGVVTVRNWNEKPGRYRVWLMVWRALATPWNVIVATL